MKKILGMFLLLVLAMLSGCASTTQQGMLTVDSVQGIFEPSVVLATAKDKSGNVTLQQIVSGPGVGTILYQGASQVGAAATFGVAAAPKYKPARNTTNVNNSNGNSAVSKGSSASALGTGGNAVSKSIADPVSNLTASTNSAADSNANSMARAGAGANTGKNGQVNNFDVEVVPDAAAESVVGDGD